MKQYQFTLTGESGYSEQSRSSISSTRSTACISPDPNTTAETTTPQERHTYEIKLTNPCAEWVRAVAIDATGPSLTATADIAESGDQLTLHITGDGFLIPAWKHCVETAISDQLKHSSYDISPEDDSPTSQTGSDRAQCGLSHLPDSIDD